MEEMGFKPFDSDLCLFYNKDTDVFIVLYVDDLLVAARNIELVNTTRNSLCKRFQLKELGDAKIFLGFEFLRDRPNKRIYLSQRRYTQQILKKFGYKDANGVQSVPSIHCHATRARWTWSCWPATRALWTWSNRTSSWVEWKWNGSRWLR